MAVSLGPSVDPLRAAAWRSARRVLAVRLDNLGDLLMTTPALAALRDSLPRAHITLLASPAGAAAAEHLPMVDAAWSFRAPWMPLGADEAAAATQREAEALLVERLAAGGFDAAVIFTVCTQSALPAALACRLAGIPLRLAHCRENPYALLTDWVRDTDVLAGDMRHEVARQLALVGAVGMHTVDQRLRFRVSPGDRQRVAGRLQALGLPADRPYAVLHPGATAASRRWPAAWFGTVAEGLVEQAGCAVVFSGGAADVACVEQARQAMARPAASLAGALSLGELAALIEGAGLLVANNSAPAHLAAALGTPQVTLYALTNPQHTPWQAVARVLSHDTACRWCLRSTCPEPGHDCLRGVAPGQVLEAALALLQPDKEPCSA